jgi:glycogen synthase
MLTSDTVGGVWQYTIQLARALARFDVDITIVSVGRVPNPDQRDELSHLPNLRDHFNLPYKLEWMQDSLSDIAAARHDLSDLVARLRPDLLHSSQFCFGDLPTACPRLVVAHSDIISWQRWCADEAAPDPNWLAFLDDYQRLVQRGLDGAQAVVAPSAFIASSISCDYALPLARIKTIHNGVSISPRLGVKQPLALMVGRLWDKAKNVALVAEAVQQAQADAGSPVRIIVAGADLPSDYKSLTNNSAIKYLGQLSAAQLYPLFARASVYIAASRYEPFGLAAVEAALHGCAILANDIPTFREVWADDALYFARNDATALRLALTQLLTEPARAASYGARAHLRALSRYNAGRMAADYYQLYRRLLPPRLWYNQGTNLSYPDAALPFGV